MHTIILLDRLGKELLPLTDMTPVALLPVASRPLIDYTLEMLATAGIKMATVVTGPFSEQLKVIIGSGQRWGLQLDFWAGRG
ncbi:MAG: NDP-sugar synthase, partial [Methylococcaceae bacterium]|nr:NDP-sugar synthase [Methylococcaceae bacterium]